MRSSPPSRIERNVLAMAISAGSSELHRRVERLALRAGGTIAVPGERLDVLLLGLDNSTPLPRAAGSDAGKPAIQNVCIIWCGEALSAPAMGQLVRSGYAGVLSIEIETAKLQAALHAIRAGMQVIDPRLVQKGEGLGRSAGDEALTEREQEVFGMMGRGLSNKEIAALLSISTHTVKFHISSILGKLGAASRTEAVSLGVKRGRLTI